MKHAAGIQSASLWVTLLIALCGQAAWSQSALINEWSQGNGGAREWVEILVVQDNLDMRGFKLTDGANDPLDGLEFNPSSALDPNPSSAAWSSVPAGTLIVIYNGNSRDTVLPPDDLVVAADGNHLVLAPHNNTDLFISSGWQTFEDADNTDSPRLWDGGNTLIHDWDQGDSSAFLALHPGSGYAAAYQGNSAADVSQPTQWRQVPASLGNVSPGKGNGGDNSRWIASLRGSGPLVETSLGSLDFGSVVVSGAKELSYEVTGYDLTTSITVAVPPYTGFAISTTPGSGWAYTILLNKVGGRVYVRFSPGQDGLHTAMITNVWGIQTPAVVTCTGTGFFVLPGLDPNDVIFNEYMIGDSGTTPYASLGGATITGDWAELLVANGPVDLRSWIVTDNDTPASANEGVVVISNNPAFSAIPRGTVILMIFGASSVPEDLDFSDGKMVLKTGVGNSLSALGSFSLDPNGDNLVLLALSGSETKALDYIAELQSNPSSAATAWGLTFQPEFTGITSNMGCWFSVDKDGGFNNDNGSNSYALVGYGWNVGPAKTTHTPGMLNPRQAFATIHVSPASLDFGAISPYDSKVLPLLISNTGTIPLQINESSAITGFDAADFRIEPGQLPLAVPRQQTTTLNIRFAPNGDLGLLDNAILLLQHNDASAGYLSSIPLSGTSQPGMSELLFYEPFDYVAGPLYMASGGVWQHTAGNYGNYEVEDADSLSYPGLRKSLGRLVRHGRTFNTASDTSRDEDVLRQFQLYTPPDFGEKPLYASLLVNVAGITSSTLSPNGDYFCHFYDGSTGFGFRGRLYARLTQAGRVPMVQYGLKFSGYGDPVFASSLVPLQETAFLVMKMTMVAEQLDRVELFINPAPDQDEPGSSLLALSAGFDHDILEGIGAFGLRQGENTIEGRIDEIRVGWTWASVTANSTAPYLMVRKPLWLNREDTRQITKDYLRASDMQTPSPLDLTFTLTQLPRHGDLLFSGLEMNLSSRSTFSQYDVNSGRISYRQNGDYVSYDGFLFRLSDPDGRFIDSSFDFVIGNFARSRYWNQYK